MILLFLVVMFSIYFIPKYLKFNGSKYQKASGNSFAKTIFDKGNYGEFLTFYLLEKLSSHYRLLTNLYLPKKDGSTTEIDVLLIADTGLYVFESKNYSGWIFGDENHKHWTQTFPNKQKEKFFNPIWQNKAHIKVLQSVLGGEDEHLFKSFIIFSERCKLKKITVTSPQVKVIKRNNLLPTIKRDINNSEKLLSQLDIDQLYLLLKKYSHAADEVKAAHIRDVQMKR